jgi:hypothetical protein
MLMRERFAGHEQHAIENAESQVTVTSAGTFQPVSPVPMDDPISFHHSQLLEMTDADCQEQSVPNPTSQLHSAESAIPDLQSQNSEWCEPIDDSEGLEEFNSTCLRDSQDSTVSDLALDTRSRAFQAILENAKGKAGWEIGLLSTTDNHSKLDEELTYTGHMG